MSRRSPQEDQAHRFADAGWFTFPTAPGSKIPVTEHGYLDATTDHKTIQQWWRSEPESNVAVATGHPGPDVVDIDRKGDRSGYGAWNDVKRAGLSSEPMAAIRTPSGGAHLYYRGTSQRNGHLPEKLIDFRSTGGYVVAPPSKGPDGRPYEVVRKQPSAATVDWQKIREHLDPQAERQPSRPSRAIVDTPRDLGHLAPWLAEQQEGNRNAGLFWAANRAIEAGDTATLGKLATAARETGLDDREIDRTIRSAQQANHGSARPFAREQAVTGQRVPLPRADAEPRQQEREPATARQAAATVPATVPTPRADVERATAAGIAAARSHKEAEPEREPGA